jgi:hypothetical protein
MTSDTHKNDARSDIREELSFFEQAILSAKAAGLRYDEQWVEATRQRFTTILGDIDSAASKRQLDKLVDQAEDLACLRAYLCPDEDIPIAGEIALSTMRSWSVPNEALTELERAVTPVLTDKTETAAARGALFHLLGEQLAWSNYLDDYNTEMEWITWGLAGAIVLTLGAALYSITHAYLIVGLFLAGLCGALVSVISKVPTVIVSGDNAPYLRRVLRRTCTGLAASVIGVGLLVSGIVTIGLKDTDISRIIEACAETNQSPVDAKSTVGPETKNSATDLTSSTCRQSHVLILMALVMLFGFSERALTSFEDRLFPSAQAGDDKPRAPRSSLPQIMKEKSTPDGGKPPDQSKERPKEAEKTVSNS